MASSHEDQLLKIDVIDQLILTDPSVIRTKGGRLVDTKIFESPVYFQKGSGLFSVLSEIAGKALPFITRHVTRSVLEMASHVLGDVNEGRS